MITLSKYGVQLKMIEAHDLEMVRNWRNDPDINKYLFSRGYISEEKQKTWFSGLNKRENQYFIINYDGKSIGLIQVVKIDYTEKVGCPGIFIADKNCGNPMVAFNAMLCLYDYCFDFLGFESLYVEVLKWNKRALRFDKAFGYIVDETKTTDEYYSMILTRKDYETSSRKLRKVVMNNLKSGQIEL